MRNHSALSYKKIAIVGASKLTENEERDAEQFCGIMMNEWKAQYGDKLLIISGGAKGVDTIAEDCAKQLDIKTVIFKPEVEQWENKGDLVGYKTRNIVIAESCDEIYCLPANLRDVKCYHCNENHQKSGGCFVLKQCKKLGKKWRLIPPINR